MFTNILPWRRYRLSHDIMEVLLFKELFKNLGYSSLYTLQMIEWKKKKKKIIPESPDLIDEPWALCPGSHMSYTAIQKTITCIPTSLSFTIYPDGTTAIIQTLDYSNLPGGMMAVHKSLSSTLPGSEVNSYMMNRNKKLPVPCNKKEHIGRMKRRNGWSMRVKLKLS